MAGCADTGGWLPSAGLGDQQPMGTILVPFLVGLTGPAGLTGLVCFMALTAVYVRMGVGAAIVALDRSPAGCHGDAGLVPGCFGPGRYPDGLPAHRSGLYLLVTMVSMLLSMLPSLLDSGIMDGMAADIDFLKSVADILAGRHWAPLSVCRRISFRDHGGLWSDVCVWSWPPWLSA